MGLSDADHDAMDAYVAGILEAYKAGEIDLLTARSDLVHAISAAALGHERTFKKYIRLAPKERWRHG
jgi:hypothetical protein